MACELTVWNRQTGQKQVFTCDEDNAGKIIEQEHAGHGTGRYTDVAGKSFEVDWTKSRLIRFVRQRSG